MLTQLDWLDSRSGRLHLRAVPRMRSSGEHTYVCLYIATSGQCSHWLYWWGLPHSHPNSPQLTASLFELRIVYFTFPRMYVRTHIMRIDPSFKDSRYCARQLRSIDRRCNSAASLFELRIVYFTYLRVYVHTQIMRIDPSFKASR